MRCNEPGHCAPVAIHASGGPSRRAWLVNEFHSHVDMLNTLSAVKIDRVHLAEYAKVIARALTCHPSVLVFPGWEGHLQPAA